MTHLLACFMSCRLLYKPWTACSCSAISYTGCDRACTHSVQPCMAASAICRELEHAAACHARSAPFARSFPTTIDSQMTGCGSVLAAGISEARLDPTNGELLLPNCKLAPLMLAHSMAGRRTPQPAPEVQMSEKALQLVLLCILQLHNCRTCLAPNRAM